LFKVDLLQVALENGRRARREIVRHRGAVAVICRMRDGRFAFVRQFRKAIESDLLEIVAGIREPRENAAACARREVMEETGYKVTFLRHLGAIYTAPGFCDERIDIFFAQLGRKKTECRPDPDEQLELVCVPEKDVYALITAGRINDAKTLAAWLLYLKGVKRGNVEP
jgi:ADP-ribose pyrophosphatase